MAIAVLSPVSMKAANEYNVDLIFELDGDEGYYLTTAANDVYFNKTATPRKDVVGVLYSNKELIDYDGWLVDDGYLTSKTWQGYTTVNAKIYIGSKRADDCIYDDKFDATTKSAIEVALQNVDTKEFLDTTIWVVLEPTMDFLTEGVAVEDGQGDSRPDYKQSTGTVAVEGWSDRKEAATGEFVKTLYVISSEKTAKQVVRSQKEYGQRNYVGTGSNRTYYSIVWYINGNDIEAVWEEQPEELIVVGEAKNPLDANGDGIVTCEEAHGKGWVWAGDDKGCQYTGGSTYIVNTATK